MKTIIYGYHFVAIDGKLLVEDIVKLGSWREDGNAHEDDETRERL